MHNSNRRLMAIVAIAAMLFLSTGCKKSDLKHSVPYESVLRQFGIEVRTLQLTKKESEQVAKIQICTQDGSQMLPEWHDIKPLAADQTVIIASQQKAENIIYSLIVHPTGTPAAQNDQTVTISTPIITTKSVTIVPSSAPTFTLNEPQLLYVNGIPPFDSGFGGHGQRMGIYVKFLGK